MSLTSSQEFDHLHGVAQDTMHELRAMAQPLVEIGYDPDLAVDVLQHAGGDLSTIAKSWDHQNQNPTYLDQQPASQIGP